MKKTTYSKDPAGKTMLVEREFNGSVELVWKAWTDPEILAEWWAPHPFKAITKSMDFREGGRWLYYMLGPDGTKFWCLVGYVKIEPLKRFTGEDAFCDEEGNKNGELPESKWDVTFTPTTTGTKVNAAISYESKEDLEKIMSMGFEEGFAAAHGNLDEWLEKNK